MTRPADLTKQERSSRGPFPSGHAADLDRETENRSATRPLAVVAGRADPFGTRVTQRGTMSYTFIALRSGETSDRSWPAIWNAADTRRSAVEVSPHCSSTRAASTWTDE